MISIKWKKSFQTGCLQKREYRKSIPLHLLLHLDHSFRDGVRIIFESATKFHYLADNADGVYLIEEIIK